MLNVMITVLAQSHHNMKMKMKNAGASPSPPNSLYGPAKLVDLPVVRTGNRGRCLPG